MAFETEYDNWAHQTDVLSVGISAALVDAVVAVPLIYSEDLAETKLFQKDGSLVAEDINESAAYTPSANSELVQSTVSAAAAKTVVVSKLTVEAQEFKPGGQQKLMMEQGKAIARKYDAHIKALATGFTGSVDSGTAATPSKLLEALYTVQESANIDSEIAILLAGRKCAYQLRDAVQTSGASVWSNPNQTSLLQGVADLKGFAGELPGVRIYQTGGIATAGGNDVNLLYFPSIAIAGMYSAGVKTRTVWVGAGGFWDEISSYAFSKVVEWNDEAGVRFLHDS